MTGSTMLRLILDELQSLPDCHYSVQFMPGIEAAISVEWRNAPQISIVIDNSSHVGFTLVENRLILKPRLYVILNSLSKIFAKASINIFEHNGKLFFESFLPIWIRSEDIRHASRTTIEFLLYAYNLTKEMAFVEYIELTKEHSDIEGFTDSSLNQDRANLGELDDEDETEIDTSIDADEDLTEGLLESFEKEKRKNQFVAIIRSLSGMTIDLTKTDEACKDENRDKR